MRITITHILLILVLAFSWTDGSSQDRTRRHKRGSGPSNPYIDRKAKNKPSAKLARENRKGLKKTDRAVKRQKRRMRKKHP